MKQIQREIQRYSRNRRTSKAKGESYGEAKQKTSTLVRRNIQRRKPGNIYKEAKGSEVSKITEAIKPTKAIKQAHKSSETNSHMSKEVFNEGPTTSQHVEADDEDFFKKTTFKLKRTRSMGLLDDFISQAHGPVEGDEESISASSAVNPKKITSRDFVSNATLQRLNLVPSEMEAEATGGAQGGGGIPGDTGQVNSPYTPDELSHVPSFYREVIPSHKKNLHGAGDAGSGSALVPKHEQKLQELRSKQEERIRQHNIDLMTSHVLHDDTDVEDRPKQHVDYLSHKWRAADEVLKCWRYVVTKKHDFADAARLENASWRTWAQTRNHLKTISPEELNWSKDSDVTWLYGPAFWDETSGARSRLHSAAGSRLSLHSEATAMASASDGLRRTHTENDGPGAGFSVGSGSFAGSHSSAARNGVVEANAQTTAYSSTKPGAGSKARRFSAGSAMHEQHPEHLKSILKKRTNVENLIGDGSYSRLQSLLEEREHKFHGSPILEPGSSPLAESRPSTPSPLALDGPSGAGGSGACLRGPEKPLAGQQKKSSLKKHQPNLMASLAKKPQRHIRFNTKVEQCIAVDRPDPREQIEPAVSQDVSLIPADSPTDFPYTDETEQSFNEYYDGNDSSSSSSSDSSSSSSSVVEGQHAVVASNYDDESDDFVFGAASASASPQTQRDGMETEDSEHKFMAIAPLPATTLKMDSDDEDLQQRSLYTVSHNTRTNRGYEYYYDYNTVYSDSSNPMYPVVAGNNGDVQMVDVPPEVLGDDVQMAAVPAQSVQHAQNAQNAQNSVAAPVAIAPSVQQSHRRDSTSSQASHRTFVLGSDFDSDYNSDSASDSDASYSSRSSSASFSGSGSGSSLNLNTNLASQSHLGPGSMSRNAASSSSQHSNGSFVFNSDSEDDSDTESADGWRSPLQRAPAYVPNLPSFNGSRGLAATSNATAVSSAAPYRKKKDSYASLASLAAHNSITRGDK